MENSPGATTGGWGQGRAGGWERVRGNAGLLHPDWVSLLEFLVLSAPGSSCPQRGHYDSTVTAEKRPSADANWSQGSFLQGHVFHATG